MSPDRGASRLDETDRGDRLEEPPDLEEVMAVIFGLGTPELRTLRAIADAPGSTTRELAGNLDRDRSSVNRALSTLREKGLVVRERRLFPSGGTVDQYFVADPARTRDRFQTALDRWTHAVHARLEKSRLLKPNSESGEH